MSTIDDFLNKRRRMIEHALIENVEIIEGRVPTNVEISRYGQMAIYPDGTEEWKWRGTTILIVRPTQWKMHHG